MYIKVVDFESYRIPCGLFYYQFSGIKGGTWKSLFPFYCIAIKRLINFQQSKMGLTCVTLNNNTQL
jgi:hypothetical protein